MTVLYIAAENISAGTEVIVRPGYSEYAHACDRLSVSPKHDTGVIIGVAAEGLREGFRIVARGNEVYEDDA